MSIQELLDFAKDGWPEICRGRVTHLTRDGKMAILPDGVIGYLDEHPEGAAPRRPRSVWLEDEESGERIFHDQSEGEWVE